MQRKIYQFNPNNGIKVVMSPELNLKLALKDLHKAYGVKK